MSDKIRLPEVMVFAGPNGSGKSTITRMVQTVDESKPEAQDESSGNRKEASA